MRGIRSCYLIIASLLLTLSQPATYGETQTDGYVSRKEYDELKQQMLALKKEVETLKKEKGQSTSPPAVASTAPAADFDKQPAAPIEEQKSSGLGTTKFLITGDGETTFEAQNHNTSTFTAAFNPVFLWEINPRLLFEAEVSFELSKDGTDVGLEYAQLSYLLNDYITLGAGEFLTPSNVWMERFHPSWINKLPDHPLAVHDGILPEKSVGAQIRGAFPIGPTKLNLALYVSNGPKLITDDPGAAGMLRFENSVDNNDNKAVGGRIGFMPFSEFEVGYGFEVAKPGDQGTPFANVHSVLQSVDVNFTHDSDLLRGVIDLHAQYAWTRVGHAVYDPDGSLGFGPLSFSNKRDGGYAQIAYRPMKVDFELARKFEFVFRWDHLNQAPQAPGALDEERWTVGVDYWLGPSTALKAAYEWDQPHGQPNTNALLLQAVTGF